MRYLFLFFFFFASISSKAVSSTENTWLNVVPTDRFTSLETISIQSLDGYQELLLPYLTDRKVSDSEIESYVHKDLFHLAHALSVLFEKNSVDVLQNLLGDHFSLVEEFDIRIDHVGRELFGPLSFYLPLLKKMAPSLGLTFLKEIVFPSTQVVKALQKSDPTLQSVTIGRIYFQNDTGQVRCLELFQAFQHINATKERISLLTNPMGNPLISPIDHLSIELEKVEDVQKIHERIQNLSSKTLIPCQEEISYNPGDGSSQTKALIRNSDLESFNKIIEFVHYGFP